MNDTNMQTVKDIIRMTPKLNTECLNSVKVLMEKAIDAELLRLEPTIILENMDIAEKVMYLEYLTESDETRAEEKEKAISIEEILKREGLNIDDL